eukprot:768718-Hanusia_phi.AAC.6
MTGVYATYKTGTIPVYRSVLRLVVAALTPGRYYNNFDHDHVYTTNYKKWGKVRNDVKLEGGKKFRDEGERKGGGGREGREEGGSAERSQGGSYRTPDGEHGYTYEGVAFYIYKYPRQGLQPVYAFVNPKNGNKIFSMSTGDAGPHSANFKMQGIIGYAG